MYIYIYTIKLIYTNQLQGAHPNSACWLQSGSAVDSNHLSGSQLVMGWCTRWCPPSYVCWFIIPMCNGWINYFYDHFQKLWQCYVSFPGGTMWVPINYRYNPLINPRYRSYWHQVSVHELGHHLVFFPGISRSQPHHWEDLESLRRMAFFAYCLQPSFWNIQKPKICCQIRLLFPNRNIDCADLLLLSRITWLWKSTSLPCSVEWRWLPNRETPACKQRDLLLGRWILWKKQVGRDGHSSQPLSHGDFPWSAQWPPKPLSLRPREGRSPTHQECWLCSRIQQWSVTGDERIRLRCCRMLLSHPRSPYWY